MDMEQDELNEILDEFHMEAEEGLDTLEQDLIKLENLAEAGDTDADTVDRLFRVLHTLKGGAGFLSLDKMAKLAHAGENLLDEIRAGHVQVDTAAMDALLETNDLLRELLECSRERKDTDSVDTLPLVERLEKLAHPGDSPAPADENQEPAAQEKPQETQAPPTAEDVATTSEASPPIDVEINEELLAEVMGDDRLAGGDDEGGEPVEVEAVEAEATDVEINAELLAEVMGDEKLAGGGEEAIEDAVEAASNTDVEINEELLAEVLGDDRLEGGEAEAPTADAAQVKPPAKPAAAKKEEKTFPFERRADDRRQGTDERRKAGGRRTGDPQEVTIRVDTSRLDAVMNLVGELVLARNSLNRQMGRSEVATALEGLEASPLIHGNIESLTRISRELQMSVLRTRMQPIKRVFDKIPRQVRQLKNKLGKDVELVIEGENTEIDRTLVDELADPMVHLIRNALDHGLEGPEERQEIGKPTTGTLSIRAFYEGNNVVIQVQEDGRGIDVERVKSKAIEKGIINEQEAAEMSDKEAARLVMAPGFSTAEQISDVSGRGVGMDVVNAKITSIKGSIDLESQLGMGTTVSIYLPLTLAIVQALVVASCDESFAVPIGSISEVIKYRKEDVHEINAKDAIELRGEVLPLIYLQSITTQAATSRRPDDGFIIVVREGGLSMGLVVEELLGQEEAVVKSITKAFEYNSAISGATISGDGNVHMILDVPYMMRETVTENKSLTRALAGNE